VILVDTSVWVNHLRSGDPRLAALLERVEVLMPPWMVGELACGHRRARGQVLALLEGLLAATLASHREVLVLIEGHPLAGRGVCYLDAHLLAAARLSGSWLWTLERKQLPAAEQGLDG
jgi:hypothetical protein